MTLPRADALLLAPTANSGCLAIHAAAPSSVLFVLPPGGAAPFFAEHLGTAFLRAMLAREGVASEQYLPGRNVSLATFARDLAERRPAAVGFTVYETNLEACRALARVVRGALPEAVVMVGGPNATFSPEETLGLVEADVCLRGAGEGTIVPVVQAIQGSEGPRRRLPDLLAAIPGLVVRAPDGAAVRTPAGDLSSFPSTHFRCLDDLPSPYLAGLVTTAEMGLLTSRGCNQHCTYCSFAEISARKVHYHGVERVLDDIAAYKQVVDRVERRSPTISFSDDAFTLAPQRARAICEGIVARGLQMPFNCATRADRVDEDLLRLMTRAGFVSVSFGLESAVPRVLRAIGKVRDPASRHDAELAAEREYLERVRLAVAAARRAGLSPSVSVIGGLPGETEEDFRATLAFVEGLGVDGYAHNVLSLLPGTPLYRDRARHGLDAGRDAGSGAWVTRHAYDAFSVAPLASSTVHADLWSEANELCDALCGRPRPERTSDDAAWAVVVHADAPDARIAAWLPQVLAVHGAVVVVAREQRCGTADAAEWVRLLARAMVPWGLFDLLSPARDGNGPAVLRSCARVGAHRVELAPAWRAGDGVEAGADGGCRVAVWIASAPGAAPPPTAEAEAEAPFPPTLQIADGCRFWSGWRRCRRPRVLHAWADGTVRPCWHGPPIGAVGDGHAALLARAEALSADAGPRADPCPLQRGSALPPDAAAAAEGYEIAASASWFARPDAAGTT